MEASPASPVKDSILGSRLSSILTELQSRQLQQDAPKPHSAEIIKKEISAEVAVLLMGVTGSGKSSFIRRVTQNEDVRVGNSLQSMTQTIETYPFETSTTKFLLIDTPGFNDTWLTDRDILDELASWLSSSYKSGLHLNGAIYLHRIQDTRMEGSALRSLRVFKRLCGDEFMKNVVLGTTFWDLVSEKVGKAREDELCSTGGFFKDMMDMECDVVRISNERNDNLVLLEKFTEKTSRIMSIQQELSDGKSVGESAAAKEIGEELAELQRMNKEKLDDVKHVAQRQLTVAELNKLYSLRLTKREHEEVESKLKKEQDELKKEGEEKIEEQNELIEELKRNSESQKRGFQMKMDELNERLRVMKAEI